MEGAAAQKSVHLHLRCCSDGGTACVPASQSLGRGLLPARGGGGRAPRVAGRLHGSL